MSFMNAGIQIDQPYIKELHIQDTTELIHTQKQQEISNLEQ